MVWGTYLEMNCPSSNGHLLVFGGPERLPGWFGEPMIKADHGRPKHSDICGATSISDAFIHSFLSSSHKLEIRIVAQEHVLSMKPLWSPSSFANKLIAAIQIGWDPSEQSKLHSHFTVFVFLYNFKKNISGLSIYSGYHISLCRSDPLFQEPPYRNHEARRSSS